MPTGNAGQSTPTWNAGRIASVNVETDELKDNDILYFDATGNKWVTGPVPSDAYSIIYASTGSASTPSYAFNGDTDTGMYNSSTNEIGFATGGTERLTISDSYITSTIPVAQPYATAAGTDAGVVIPDGTVVFKLTAGTETGAYALTAPTGVAGQVLYVRNDSGQATTGLVVASGSGATFAHDGASFLQVS